MHQHRRPRHADVRGHRRHHQRPAGNANAAGGRRWGPKNDQSIQDLVAYLRSIQLTPDQAQAQAAKDLAGARTEPADNVKAAEKQLAADAKTLAQSRAGASKALAKPDVTDAELTTACKAIIKEITAHPSKTSDRKSAVACGTFTTDADTVTADRAALAWTRDWQRRRQNVQDGQLLFELNCARCHTAGWSSFDPALPPGQPGSVSFLGLPAGGADSVVAPRSTCATTTRSGASAPTSRLTALYFFARVLRSPDRRWLVCWALASALAMCSHYFGAFPFIAEAGWLLFRREWRPRALAATAAVAWSAWRWSRWRSGRSRGITPTRP